MTASKIRINWRKIFTYLALILATYLGLGYLFHLVIFPEEIPPISTYFDAGDEFKSDYEGFTQTVIKQEDGRVYCKLKLKRYAPGPPLHIHTGFEEYFENGSEPLQMIVEKDTITLKPFEKLLIPKGVAHKPFNSRSNEIDLTMKEFAFPEEFAFYLNQVYGYMDEDPANMKPPKVIFQMAMFNQYFDSYAVEHNVPIIVQKTIGYLIVPMARMMGYKSYYKKYDQQ